MDARTKKLITEFFEQRNYADVPARELYDFVVTRRGSTAKLLKATRLEMGISKPKGNSYQIGKAWWFKWPKKNESGIPEWEVELSKKIYEELKPLANGFKWEEFKGPCSVALKQLKNHISS